MPVGKPWSKGSGKPLMTLQQLSSEIGIDIDSLRAKIRRSPDRPKPKNKTIGRNGAESCSYYDSEELRAFGRLLLAAIPASNKEQA